MEMDPFLQGDIPVMVLRYLAVNKCEAAAMAFIDEMPMLKSYIPPKPPSVSNEQFLKHLSRSSVNPSLKDILYDFGHSKILAEEILDSGYSDLPSADTLLAKINSIQVLLKSQPSSNSVSSLPRRDTVVASSTQTPNLINNNTNILCSRCQNLPKEGKPRTESSCQTEEITAVQFGLQDEIPVIFYRTLLNDDNLQLKIAQTINEHLHDPADQQSGDMVQRISLKAETEIDKFLVDLLHDMPEDSNDGLSQPNSSGTVSVYNPDLDSNLSSMFKDAESLLRSTILPTNVPKETTSNLLSFAQPHVSADDSYNKSVPPHSVDAPSITTPAPKKSNKRAAVKRITPTRLSPNTNGNPVFNASVVIHEHKLTCGPKSLGTSSVSVNHELPPWRKLNRKPITPKIPGKPIISQIKEVTVINKDSKKVKVNVPVTNFKNVVNEMAFQAKELNKTEQNLPLPTVSCPVTLTLAPPTTPKVPKKGTSSFTIPLRCPNLPPPPSEEKSSHKRKTTPVKLTPEKATNYNFMHVYHDSKQPSATKRKKDETPHEKVIEAASTSKALPVDSVPPPPNDLFTPIQPPILSETKLVHSDLTISPNALQRLIVSANKLESTSSSAHALVLHRKKSYSTPRKRRHVRNLTFTTPPSLKALTPASADAKDNSRKRKAPEDVDATNAKSKKRLNWPESGKKLERRITPKKSSKTDNTQSNSSSDKNMSVILEESITSAPPQIIVNPPNDLSPPNPPVPIVPSQNSSAFPSTQTPSKASYTLLPVQPSAVTSNLPFQCFRVSDQQFVPLQTILASGPSQGIPTPATPILKIVPPPEISATENTVFNIVPAPIGFPDPTPMKFFGDMSLNCSDAGSRSTLVTPLKPYGDTHFTLPPTPRMIEEDSNSRHSLRLMFDGSVYPAQLLGFTPNLKEGVPRTPGRGSSSSSSNSQSPLKPDAKVQPPQVTVEVVVPPEQVKDSVKVAPQGPDKSDGELTSSDDGTPLDMTPESPISRKVQKVVPYSQNQGTTPVNSKVSPEAINPPGPQLLSTPVAPVNKTRKSKNTPPIQWQCDPEKKTTPPVILLPLPTMSNEAMNRRSAKSLSKAVEMSQIQSHNPAMLKISPPPTTLRKPPPMKPKPVPGVSISPITQQIQGINFKVGSRGKKLTLSEQETLYSLIKIGVPQTTVNLPLVEKKFQIPRKVEAKNVIELKASSSQGNSDKNANECDSSRGNLTQTPKPSLAKNTEEVSPHALLQNKKLSDLLKLARRKKEQGSRN